MVISLSMLVFFCPGDYFLGSCLQLPVYNYNKDYSGMCLLEVSTGTSPQLNSDSLIHKPVTTKKDISSQSFMSAWYIHRAAFWYNNAIKNASFKMLVSITVHYIKRIKELQEVWSTHFWDCFWSIALCSSGLFLQYEGTYTVTTHPK